MPDLAPTGDDDLDAALAEWAAHRRGPLSPRLEQRARVAPVHALIVGFETALEWSRTAVTHGAIASSAAGALAKALVLRREEASDDFLVSQVGRDLGPAAGYVRDALLGLRSERREFPPTQYAGPRVLSAMADRIHAPSPWLACGVGAACLLGWPDLPRRVAAVAADDHETWRLIRVYVTLTVPLTSDWLDTFASHGAEWWVQAGSALRKAGDPALLLHMLTLDVGDATAIEVAHLLRLRGGPGDAGPLRSIADTRFAAREAQPVLRRVADELAAARPLPPPLPELGAVGTDGGPVVLVPAERIDDWSGALPPVGRTVRARAQLGGAATDYDEACTGPDRVRAMERDGMTLLVLPSQAVGFARPDDGTALWAVLQGSPEGLALVRRELRFRRLGARLRLPSGRLWAHDAAAPGAEREHSLAIDLEAGDYGVEQARTDDERGFHHVVRLRRLRTDEGSRSTLPPR